MIEINKIYNMDCLQGMKQIEDNSIDLVVNSPPYYNARDYSQYNNLDEYLEEMESIFKEIYRILKNHRVLVLNVGDVICKIGKQSWTSKRIPLGAYFTIMCEKIGFEFVDDYIWDKGEVESKRQLGNAPYPFYQYPINCYEHILIFHKHELNNIKIPCPICGSLEVLINGQTEIGVQSWECNNLKCPIKSKSGRGYRYSERSIMMMEYKKEENKIESELIKKWRRDIIKINPVIKINNKKENILGHSAPYPLDIPLMAIKFFSGVGDIVLDPFMGSGTTAVACKQLNRNFIGFEINPEYCEIAETRIKEMNNTSL